MLGSLKLRHFRCFEQFETEFAPGTNFIVGPNARGKTSLLEAACIVLRLQSPRITQLARVVQHGRRGFVTDGFFGARHLQFYFGTERKKLALDSVEQTNAKEWLQIYADIRRPPMTAEERLARLEETLRAKFGKAGEQLIAEVGR